MATPHNSAENGQFAPTVLMPGDPLRARWLAGNFLKDVHLITSVRNIYGYTGRYDDREVSVMASGMGMPSIGIYSYELFSIYDVQNIIRIGSAGAYSPDLKLMDIVLADAAWSESSFAKAQNGDESAWKYPSEELNDVIIKTADENGITLTRGNIHSSDVFYHEENEAARVRKDAQDKKLLCVEMESFALFHNAQILGKRAACLLTISDSFVSDDHIDSDAREKSFADMAELALKSAVNLHAQRLRTTM